MKIRFRGEIHELKEGIQALSGQLPFEATEDGIPIKVEKRPGTIEVAFDGNEGFIKYQEKIHFFRALGLLVERFIGDGQKSFTISETPQFDTNGAMFDCSRNGVLTVASIKKLLRNMAIMGLNMMMLYTEDTYTVEGERYFGYMRGKYTYEELKEADDFADLFGIEMIPCIQTLGHLDRFLRWEAETELRDTKRILLAGEQKTYALIEKMIVSASAPFRSNRIHIGMDEAHELGLGKYLDRNGFNDRFHIMTEHLKRVIELTNKYHLKAMLWSDMFFRLASPNHSYFDEQAVIPQAVIDNIPQEADLVLWDYNHTDEAVYQAFISKHKAIHFMPVFAGGVHTWNGVCTQYGKTLHNSDAALSACKKEGVREVFATVWGDNGTENNYFTTLLGLQNYAEQGYAQEPDPEKRKKRVEFCTGIAYDAFLALGQLDEIPGIVTDFADNSNPSKFLLWQDIVLGVFDKHIEKYDIAAHYTKLGEQLTAYSEKNETYQSLFDVPAKLCGVLEIKAALGVKIKKAYDDRDYDMLKHILEHQLPMLGKRVNELRIAHRNQWFQVYKPHGWEVLDIRYGGVLARIDSVKQRLSDYLAGRVKKIEELEEERLYFDGIEEPQRETLGRCPTYREIISANACLL